MLRLSEIEKKKNEKTATKLMYEIIYVSIFMYPVRLMCTGIYRFY